MTKRCQLMGGGKLESPLVFVSVKRPLSTKASPLSTFCNSPEQDTFVRSVVLSCSLVCSLVLEKSGRQLAGGSR